MLRKKAAVLLGAVIISIGAAASAQAEESTEALKAEAVTEAESSAEQETELLQDEEAAKAEETEAARIPEVIVVQIEDGEPVEIANTAGLAIAAVSVEPGEEEGTVDVTMAEKNGITYEFKKVNCADMQDPQLVMDGAFAYITYTGLASGKERSVGQTGELEYEKPAELFAVDEVYIRAESDSDSEIVGVINRGDAIEVLGETSTHYKVKKDDVVGYSVRKCISEDEQDAIAAVQAEEAAREAIRQAEAAAAAQRAAAQSSSKKEVKRQKFDDCDGSGHGYYLITYSDGSTGIQEY